MAENLDNDTPQEEETRQISVRLPLKLIKQIKLACVHEDLTLKEFVACAVKEKLKRAGHWEGE